MDPQPITAADLHPSLLRFPRNRYNIWLDGDSVPEPTDSIKIPLAEGARRATRAWKAAARSGDWRAVSNRCFALSIFDKVLQLMTATRYDSCTRWPPCWTVRQWRALIDNLIDIAMTLALSASEGHLSPPHKGIRIVIRAMADWFYRPGDSVQPFPLRFRPQLDIVRILGEFGTPPPRSAARTSTHHPGSVDTQVVKTFARLQI
ncbi:uncharacterized protein COLE_04536 [Cutaneotrichosporon oleaginosum]|nr:hypothetical protein COLE_04536 [Cutaneotrichosporon oleaginosum]